MGLLSLRRTIASVDQNISSRRVRTRVARQIKIRPTQLNRLAFPTHGNRVPPNTLRLRRHEVTDLGRYVPRGDAVCSRELHPLNSETLAHVLDIRLCGIVRGLHLRDVRNVT